jgi:hypothetical protein
MISSTHVMFLVNLDNFFVVVCTGFTKVVVSTIYVPDFIRWLSGTSLGPRFDSPWERISSWG